MVQGFKLALSADWLSPGPLYLRLGPPPAEDFPCPTRQGLPQPDPPTASHAPPAEGFPCPTRHSRGFERRAQ